MSSIRGDFGRGLIVVGPVCVVLFLLYTLYSFVASVTPALLLNADSLEPVVPAGESVREPLAAFLRVLSLVGLLTVAMYAVGRTTGTTLGELFEGIVDYLANRLPVVRVVYNASKTATESAFGDGETLQTPVRVETWDGLRMTAFKTGRTTVDGRVTLFLPTSPNVTTGFVLEVSSDRVTELDESIEEALTRVLSAGFGDANRSERSFEGTEITVVGELEVGGSDRDGS